MQFFYVFILFILNINFYLNFLPVFIVLKIIFIEKILTCKTEDMLVVVRPIDSAARSKAVVLGRILVFSILYYDPIAPCTPFSAQYSFFFK
jgi:hypothetical protein